MVIIFNPVAGRRRAALLWRVLDVLVHNGVRLDVAETRCSGDAACLAREAAARGEKLVVAAGGDGTIAEVANGLLGTGARLGVIPLGTANVLAHELALPFAPRAVAAALAFGRTRRLWPGLARGANEARLFVQMLGVGFDAQVVHHLPLPLKRVFGRGAYVMQALRDTISYPYAPITVRVDGKESKAASVIVSKGRFYAGRYLLAPDAVPEAPGFSVSLFHHNGAGAALMYGAALPLNLLAHAPGVQHVRAQRVDVVGNRAAPAQTDGDPAGYAPLSVTDAPEPIDVVMG
ncbi:MAG TPA: YegS/Rv2252/BmrU family lipid kinase [Acetobacteraceae bacterium]|jgi:diacylglycerol kinase (ATP)|nr:YegS/Rv2252/BmrU family lipid kinase [Acetobacteraceae bacterium]